MNAVQSIQQVIGKLGHVQAINTQINPETTQPEYFEVEVQIEAHRIATWYRKQHSIAAIIETWDWTLEYIDAVDDGPNTVLIFTVNL